MSLIMFKYWNFGSINVIIGYYLIKDVGQMIDDKKKKVMNRFIKAAVELIDEVGIENITIRNIAIKSRYNSATLYNYFENLDHLIFFGAMRNVRDYSLSLEEYLKDTSDAMDRFLRIWECFCDYSFAKPEVYNAIFFPKLSKDMSHYIAQYYSLFPEDLGVHHQTVSSMLQKADISDRNMTAVQDCVVEGFIAAKDASKLNNMTVLIYEGMLVQVLRKKVSTEKAKLHTMEYIEYIVSSMRIKKSDPICICKQDQQS